MNEHARISPLLPMYAAGSLENGERQSVARHIAGCAECQADLALWRSVSSEITTADRQLLPPNQLVERALAQVQSQEIRSSAFQRAAQLLWAQALLLRREIWTVSALVMALGFVIALLAERAAVIQLLAPLVAAGSIAMLYGPENDPAIELALATTTSPRQVLLARLALVFGYDLLLALVASFGLLALVPVELLGDLILGWLAPMTFLSALALLLSLWIGANTAIMISYLAWLARFIAAGLVDQAEYVVSEKLARLLIGYQQFWGQSLLILSLAALLAIWAILQTGRGVRRLPDYS